MSHFTVLVPAKDEAELEARLLPYHKYECTGIEQYLEFVPVEDIEQQYQKYGKGVTLKEYAESEGYHQNEAGVWGRTTNPQAKWDWWQIGGRWTGLLKLKPGGSGSNGTPGLMTDPNHDPAYCDYTLSGNVDWDGMNQSQDEKGRALTWGFISLDGSWNERAEMGWFGFHGDKVDGYDQAFWEFINNLPSDQPVYVVDCHI